MRDPALPIKTASCISERDLQELAELLGGISYGSVTVVIQNGKIVQIEKSEKLRLK